MKKILSVLLAVMLLMLTAVPAFAMPFEAGVDELKTQFVKAEGPETDGYTLDYRYYSPVKENDDTKYPLAQFLSCLSSYRPALQTRPKPSRFPPYKAPFLFFL